jgi:hypothetical protein
MGLTVFVVEANTHIYSVLSPRVFRNQKHKLPEQISCQLFSLISSSYFTFCSSFLFEGNFLTAFYGSTYFWVPQNCFACPAPVIPLLRKEDFEAGTGIQLPNPQIRTQKGEGRFSGKVARCEVFTAVNIQVEVFRFLTPCSVVVGYQSFRGPRCLHLDDEDGDSVDLRNVGILPHTTLHGVAT